MTRRQRFLVGHALAWGPMFLLVLANAAILVTGRTQPSWFVPAVICFAAWILIRGVAANTPEPTTSESEGEEIMMVRTNISYADDMKFKVEYCETGSQLEIQNKVGMPILTLACIPPAMLVRLRDEITAEIELGVKKSPFDKRKVKK